MYNAYIQVYINATQRTHEGFVSLQLYNSITTFHSLTLIPCTYTKDPLTSIGSGRQLKASRIFFIPEIESDVNLDKPVDGQVLRDGLTRVKNPTAIPVAFASLVFFRITIQIDI